MAGTIDSHRQIKNENRSDEVQPTLTTERLILRPLTLADAPDIQRLAGVREVAQMTLRIPHPYKTGMAQEWIQSQAAACKEGAGINFAITLRETGTLCGVIGMAIDWANVNAEMGYWLGMPYWGRGYCTEAAKAVLRYGFEVLELHRIHAAHFRHNPASGRVMQKIGMSYEGCRRQHVLKWGKFEDLEQYGILHSDGQQQNKDNPE